MCKFVINMSTCCLKKIECIYTSLIYSYDTCMVNGVFKNCVLLAYHTMSGRHYEENIHS